MRLNYKDPDSGSSERQRLEQVWKQTGVKPPGLDIEPLPDCIDYLYPTFWDLWNGERWEWSEVYYYQQVYDMEFSAFELHILRTATAGCLNFLSEKMRPKKTNQNASKTKPSRRR